MTLDNAQACFDLIGIPYRMPDENIDGLHCWELVERAMIEVFNIEPPIIHYTGALKDVEPVFMTQLAAWDHVAAPDRKPGDLVLLSIAGYPVHCGILIERNKMLHTLANTGSVIESVDDHRWSKRITGYYRWNGFINGTNSAKRLA